MLLRGLLGDAGLKACCARSVEACCARSVEACCARNVEACCVWRWVREASNIVLLRSFPCDAASRLSAQRCFVIRERHDICSLFQMDRAPTCQIWKVVPHFSCSRLVQSKSHKLIIIENDGGKPLARVVIQFFRTIAEIAREWIFHEWDRVKLRAFISSWRFRVQITASHVFGLAKVIFARELLSHGTREIYSAHYNNIMKDHEIIVESEREIIISLLLCRGTGAKISRNGGLKRLVTLYVFRLAREAPTQMPQISFAGFLNRVSSGNHREWISPAKRVAGISSTISVVCHVITKILSLRCAPRSRQKRVSFAKYRRRECRKKRVFAAKYR